MTKRNIAVWTTVVIGTALSLWACTRGDSPGSPTSVADGTQAADAGARAPATVGPTSRPVGPTSRPIGPGPVPVGPTARPIGPQPTPVGGGTPPPTPTPTPTGTPPQVCGTLDSFGELPETGNGIVRVTRTVNVFPSECRISAVRVEFFATTPDLSTVERLSSVLSLANFQVARAATLFNVAPGTLNGDRLGQSCFVPIVFDETGVPFPTDAPYADVYRPLGSIGQPGFTAFKGQVPNGTWELVLQSSDEISPPPLTLSCFRLIIETEAPPLASLPSGGGA